MYPQITGKSVEILLASYASSCLVRAMWIAFLLLFLAILASLFQMQRMALIMTVCTLCVVSFGALVIYMSLPLGTPEKVEQVESPKPMQEEVQ